MNHFPQQDLTLPSSPSQGCVSDPGQNCPRPASKMPPIWRLEFAKTLRTFPRVIRLPLACCPQGTQPWELGTRVTPRSSGLSRTVRREESQTRVSLLFRFLALVEGSGVGGPPLDPVVMISANKRTGGVVWREGHSPKSGFLSWLCPRSWVTSPLWVSQERAQVTTCHWGSLFPALSSVFIPWESADMANPALRSLLPEEPVATSASTPPRVSAWPGVFIITRTEALGAPCRPLRSGPPEP